MATANAMFTITDTGDLNGRNLVLNSHEEHSKTVPSSGANGVVPYYTYSDFASEFTHRKGQILTVSFDYETTGNTLSTGYIYAQHNESQIAPTAGSVMVKILDNPSGHYSKTFTVTANQSTSTKNTIRIYHKTCSPGTVVKIKNIKVETGDKETPWTPAPEDVVTALETAESKNSVYYQTSAPSGTHKVGDTWFDTNDGNKIYRWNGSSWVAAELGDSAVANLSASKLIAGSVMGNVILGGTIQAGGSDVGQDGKVLVKDANDVKVASLDKNGLVATAGSIGGWTITPTTIEKTAYDTTVTPAEYSLARLNSVKNALQLTKGDHDVDISPTSISQHTIVSAAVDEPKITISNGDITYSNVFMPIPNEHLMSFRKWTEVSASRAIKGTLAVTIYHCMNLFWAHFSGSIPAGWTAGNTQNVFIPIITGDTDLTNSALVAPPDNVTKYIIPTDLENMRISVTVRPDGQLGISRIAEPFKGNATATIAGYMETCDIFWAHIG